MTQNSKYISRRIALCDKIKHIMRENKITFEHIAQLSGFHQTNVCRMLNGKHSMSIDNLLRILDALEKAIPDHIPDIRNLINDVRDIDGN